MTCRIHDETHLGNGFKYTDRFNKRVFLKPGWNTVVIDLLEVERAPQNRMMDLSRIENVALFATDSPASRDIYLDWVYLAP
jgi:hypothetical protein